MMTSRFRILFLGSLLLLVGSASAACGSCAENKVTDDKDKGGQGDNNGRPFHTQWDGGRRVFKAFGDAGRHHRRHLGEGEGGSPIEGQPQ